MKLIFFIITAEKDEFIHLFKQQTSFLYSINFHQFHSIPFKRQLFVFVNEGLMDWWLMNIRKEVKLFVFQLFHWRPAAFAACFHSFQQKDKSFYFHSFQQSTQITEIILIWFMNQIKLFCLFFFSSFFFMNFSFFIHQMRRLWPAFDWIKKDKLSLLSCGLVGGTPLSRGKNKSINFINHSLISLLSLGIQLHWRKKRRKTNQFN